MFDTEMSAEAKEKITAKLKEFGLEESAIDERLMRTYKKISHGLTKLRILLDDKGIDATKTREIIETIVNKTLEKDLAKAKQWYEEHKDSSQETQAVA